MTSPTAPPQGARLCQDEARACAPLFTPQPLLHQLPAELPSWAAHARSIHAALRRAPAAHKPETVKLLGLAAHHLHQLVALHTEMEADEPRSRASCYPLARLLTSPSWGLRITQPGTPKAKEWGLFDDMASLRRAQLALTEAEQPSPEMVKALLDFRRPLAEQLQHHQQLIKRELLGQLPASDEGARRWLWARLLRSKSTPSKALVAMAHELHEGALTYTAELAAWDLALATRHKVRAPIGHDVAAYLRADLLTTSPTTDEPRSRAGLTEAHALGLTILRGAAQLCAQLDGVRVRPTLDMPQQRAAHLWRPAPPSSTTDSTCEGCALPSTRHLCPVCATLTMETAE